MDNKQNRQFYWEVKDFLARKQEPASKPTSSLRSTITEVTATAKPVPVPVNEIVNSSKNTKNDVSRFLSAFESLKTKQMPSDPTRSKNITVNPFNITESRKDDEYRWSAFFDSEADPDKDLRTAEQMNPLGADDIAMFPSAKNLIHGACGSLITGGTGLGGSFLNYFLSRGRGITTPPKTTKTSGKSRGKGAP